MTVRLLHFVVQPVLVTDDGELSAGPPVQPSTLTLAGLRDLVDNWGEHLASIEAQIASPPGREPT